MAVQRYLAAAPLSAGSRRIYRISLHGWSWALVGRTPPTGPDRRGAPGPVVPLALLDHPDTPGRLAAALTARSTVAGARTVRRELAVLRAAVTWWLDRGWISRDPLPTGWPGPAAQPGPPEAPARRATAGLDEERLRALFASPVPLRERTLWRLRQESGASVGRLLALDTEQLDLPARRTRPGVRPPVSWGPQAAELLPLLVAGRPSGPLFVTDRRAAARTAAADRCPLTGRARLSYRRAAELFTLATRPLDPEGHGWSLRQLRPASEDG